MPGYTLAFDPATGDLIDDGNGSFVTTNTAQTRIQLQLQCHYGECWHDDNLGSKLNEPNAFGANPQVSVPDEINRALGVLVGLGLISNLQVTAQATSASRVDAQVTCRDTSTGAVVQSFLTAGG